MAETPKVDLREYVTELGLVWARPDADEEGRPSVSSPLEVDWSSIEGLSDREREAVEAAALALRDHFPGWYREIAHRYPDVRAWAARALDGRKIKLRRIAIARIARRAG